MLLDLFILFQYLYIWTASFNLLSLSAFILKNIPDLQKALDMIGFGINVSSFWCVLHYSDTEAEYY